MMLAGVYGAGELLGRSWLDVPSMAKWHGLVNALGFTLCAVWPPISCRSRDGRRATGDGLGGS